jgi:hypothetical protein
VIEHLFRCLVTPAFFRPMARTGVEMRTDAQLKNDVMEELRWEPTVTSSEISVVAKGWGRDTERHGSALRGKVGRRASYPTRGRRQGYR